MWVCVAHVLSMQAMNFFASSNSQSDGTERALRFYDAGSSFRFFSSSICCCSYLPASSLSYERKFIERWKTISHCIAYTFIPRFGAWHTENKRQTSDNPVVPRFSSASPFDFTDDELFLSLNHSTRTTHETKHAQPIFNITQYFSCFVLAVRFSHSFMLLSLCDFLSFFSPSASPSSSQICVLNLMTTYDMPQVSSSTSQRFIS